MTEGEGVWVIETEIFEYFSLKNELKRITQKVCIKYFKKSIYIFFIFTNQYSSKIYINQY